MKLYVGAMHDCQVDWILSLRHCIRYTCRVQMTSIQPGLEVKRVAALILCKNSSMGYAKMGCSCVRRQSCHPRIHARAMHICT